MSAVAAAHSAASHRSAVAGPSPTSTRHRRVSSSRLSPAPAAPVRRRPSRRPSSVIAFFTRAIIVLGGTVREGIAGPGPAAGHARAGTDGTQVRPNHTNGVTTGHALVSDGARITDTTTSTGRADASAATTYNVIAVAFDEDINAYAALTRLKELDSQGQIAVDEAVVAERGADGAITVKDNVDSVQLAGTAGGGLTGLLLGVIGGPLGVLIGGTGGVLIGSLFDLDDAERVETTLGEIAKTVQPGHTAVLAVVTEPSAEVIDAAMAALGGTVTRRSVFDVEAEIAAAEEAERKAKIDARKELVRAHQQHDKAAVQAKLDQLKAKLHREPEKAATAAR
jgi:uncharacterized membrane protein